MRKVGIVVLVAAGVQLFIALFTWSDILCMRRAVFGVVLLIVSSILLREGDRIA